jgi:hypothetical protein
MPVFPNERPDASPVALWIVQQDLLARVQALLGTRDETKKIYQPIFTDGGPYLSNTPNLDGAFAALSKSAAGYWPTVVYELAHETVHLLDPVAGFTSWFEEGIAVAFSVEMSRLLTSHPMVPDLPSYLEALALVQRLSPSAFEAARAFRTAHGRLSSATAEALRQLCPTVADADIEKLSQQCKPR